MFIFDLQLFAEGDDDAARAQAEAAEAKERADAETEEARLQALRDSAGAKKVDDEWRYSESHVKKIHSENAARRKREGELQDQLDASEKTLKEFRDKELEAETDLKKKLATTQERAKESEKKLSEKLSASDRRFILSEAKRQAEKAGMIDLDDVGSMNLGDMRIGDDDAVQGLSEAIDALKAAKPHYFKGAQGDKPNKDGKPVVTPGRKDGGAEGKNWKTASNAEVSAQLRSMGVTA
jgi:hypothetical protein